jgi:hypothetical protein
LKALRRHLLPDESTFRTSGNVSEQILDFLVDSMEPHFPGTGHILGGNPNPSFRRLANDLIVILRLTEPAALTNLDLASEPFKS